MSHLWFLLLLLTNLLIYSFPVIVIFSERILCITCFSILAFPLEMTFLPASKTSNFRFIKT
ncbi:hypothetical protein HanIR_Chr02g0063971 [Helianthus annuus]|nr:hypothetical protein HanIR_Chr02g0063971 [Helianthus annuus]